MNALWVAAALLTAGLAGWPVTALVFRLARTIDDRADAAAGVSAGSIEDPAAGPGPGNETAARQPAGEPVDSMPPGADAAASARILRGGAIIGILERVAVALAILAGEPVAIAYVVAIKGLGRFAELKGTPVAAERFIIGTLTSMLWAAGVAVLARIFLLA